MERPHRPWREPLPAFVPTSTYQGDETAVPLGLVDEPDLQRQTWATIPVEGNDGIIVYGAPDSGKTTLLISVAAGMARVSSTSELEIYALDFGAGGLRDLESLPHVGSVVRGEDVERGARLLRWVAREIAERRTSLAQPQPSTPRPHVLVLIDGLEGFLSTYEALNRGEWIQAFPSLVADGRAVGVSFALTALRRSGTPSWLQSAFEKRVVLRQTDAEDYTLLGMRAADISRQLPGGRGYTESGREIQISMLGDGTAGGERRELLALGSKLAERYERIPAIGTLPAVVDAVSLPEPTAAGVPIGIADRTLSVEIVTVADGHVAVLGPSRSGRTNALALIAAQYRRTPQLGTQVHLLSPRSGPEDYAQDAADVVVRGTDDCAAYLSAASWEVAPAERVVLLIDDAEELLPALDTSPLVDIARRGRNDRLWIVLAMETDAARRAYSEFWTRVKRQRHALFLRPDLDLDGDLVNVRLPRRPDLAWPAGRAYLVRRGVAEVVQVARMT
jgi:S-DNA-T family DNA segregation ATPase FtsK/SpoIIIE